MSKNVLLDEYEKNKRMYLQKKYQCSKRSEYEKELKVKKFLRFCEKNGVKSISNIKTIHYRSFMESITKNVAPETYRKYALALKEFFNRAHLNIRVNPTRVKNRAIERKIRQIEKVVNITLSEEQKDSLRKII